MPEKFTKGYVLEILNKQNYKLYKDFEYENNLQSIECIDEEGYILKFRMIQWQQNKLPYKFHKSNPYTIQNIKLWLKLNKKSISLLSREYVSAGKDKLEWCCLTCHKDFDATWNSIKNGNGCPYCAGHKVSLSNCLATVNPELAKEWHPTKNEKLTPYDVVCNSHKKVWWKCSICGYEWETLISNRNRGTGCPKCTHELKKDTNYFIQEVYNLVGDEYTVLSEYINGQINILMKHNKCKNTYFITPANFLKGERCPICSNRKVLQGYNDILTTNQKLANMILNDEDKIKYTENSGVKIDWICPRCENIIKNKQIKNVNQQGLSCPKCSDGISYPEKFMYNLLEQLNINFEYQKSFNFSGKLKYDFYIEDLDMIIETHGIQHYEKSSRGKSLEEEQKNDKLKKYLCNKNYIRYIEIDCRYSNLSYIKNSILNGDLKYLLDTTRINWNKCNEYSTNSLIKVACDLWNKNRDVSEVSNIMKLDQATIRHYLRQGYKLKWCNYNSIDSEILRKSKAREATSKKVINIKTGQIFNSIREAGKILHVSPISVANYCHHENQKNTKKNILLDLMFYDEYISH